MAVRVTIYLKSGGNVGLDIKDTTVADQIEIYEDLFNPGKNKTFLKHVGPASTQLIPAENIACIDVKEVFRSHERTQRR
ncbi:hypothetical protein [Enterococcus olivae]